MAGVSPAHFLIWVIVLVTIGLMLLRPGRIPEVIWTSAGAALLCLLRLIPLPLALHAVGEGMDVYLFLTGMMLLSEVAKTYGVFDWLANAAAAHAGGSPARLFALIYAAGTAVTIFMSNDATAVVLTPAVLAAVRRAKAQPAPYLLTCAFIANAASFVLPISNPANLVVFHRNMPPLGRWLALFALPSAISIFATYALLRWYCRRNLEERLEADHEPVKLSSAGKMALGGIGVVAGVLLAASSLNKQLGLPACLATLGVAVLLIAHERTNPVRLVREISWSILPLVAGLFVMVEAVKSAGAQEGLSALLRYTTHWPAALGEIAVGGAIALGTNLVNNLPLGLIAGATLQTMPTYNALAKAVLIGIDLGPNLSITGSLATILWLIAIRREGMHFSGWEFLKAGAVIMPASFLLAIVAGFVFHLR